MFVGRKEEINLFRTAFQDSKSHFIAIYGRRRVGKTCLIREAFNNNFTFQHVGMSNGLMEDQISAFCVSLKESGFGYKKKPKKWMEAFDCLKEVIKESKEQKKVIFIDELSWMDSARSDLISALENFWNSFASCRTDVVLIVCSSATSWILSKVIHSKGGLYNRLTEQINLHPFSLRECEEYVKAEGLSLVRTQILQYYMIFGGVPFYWALLKRGLSLPQNVDRILFSEDAPLKKEFQYLYASVFKNPEVYLKIIKALGQKKIGLSREAIIKASGIVNSGDLTAKLEELEACGFIRKYEAFGMKTKNSLYQLIDNFTLFYFSFLEHYPSDEHFWSNQINTPAINSWMGLAFERVCFEHIKQIKNKLGISGVLTNVNSWFCESNPEKGLFGSQIDLLIVRKDQVINLCEMKYSVSDFTMTSSFDHNLRNKISDFVSVSKTRYAIYPTLITTFGLVQNSYSSSIQSVVVMDDLFC